MPTQTERKLESYREEAETLSPQEAAMTFLKLQDAGGGRDESLKLQALKERAQDPENIKVSVHHIAEGNFKESYTCHIPWRAGLHNAVLEYTTWAGMGPRDLEGEENFFLVSEDLLGVIIGDTKEEVKEEASHLEYDPYETIKVSDEEPRWIGGEAYCAPRYSVNW